MACLTLSEFCWPDCLLLNFKEIYYCYTLKLPKNTSHTISCVSDTNIIIEIDGFSALERVHLNDINEKETG